MSYLSFLSALAGHYIRAWHSPVFMWQLSYFKTTNKNPSNSTSSTISKIRLKELKKQTAETPQIMMGLYTSNTRMFMTNSSGILSRFAGMCLFSLQVEVGSVALSARRSHWAVALRSWVFVLCHWWVVPDLAVACWGVILLMLDRGFPLKSGRQMVLLTCCLTALSILLFPDSENASLGLEGVEKMRGKENSLLSPDKKNKKFWKGLLVRWELLSVAGFLPSSLSPSPRTNEASGGGAPCCAYAHCYINLNKSCKSKKQNTYNFLLCKNKLKMGVSVGINLV